MARVLIIPCGCRGQALARELVAAGHIVRGTTRDPAKTAAIAAAGAEPYVGDPDRIGTLMGALAGVTIVCWLMGTVPVPELHGGRLRMLFEKLVDTPVRGVVYEGTEGEAVARHLERAHDPAVRRSKQLVRRLHVLVPEVLRAPRREADQRPAREVDRRGPAHHHRRAEPPGRHVHGPAGRPGDPRPARRGARGARVGDQARRRPLAAGVLRRADRDAGLRAGGRAARR